MCKVITIHGICTISTLLKFTLIYRYPVALTLSNAGQSSVNEWKFLKLTENPLTNKKNLGFDLPTEYIANLTENSLKTVTYIACTLY